MYKNDSILQFGMYKGYKIEEIIYYNHNDESIMNYIKYYIRNYFINKDDALSFFNNRDSTTSSFLFKNLKTIDLLKTKLNISVAAGKVVVKTENDVLNKVLIDTIIELLNFDFLEIKDFNLLHHFVGCSDETIRFLSGFSNIDYVHWCQKNIESFQLDPLIIKEFENCSKYITPRSLESFSWDNIIYYNLSLNQNKYLIK